MQPTNTITRDEYRRIQRHAENIPDPKPVDREADLLADARTWLEDMGYRNLKRENAVLEGKPVGWYGHLTDCERNAFMADLFIFNQVMTRCLMIELKHPDDKGRIHWGIGQRQMVERQAWKLATDLDMVKRLVYGFEAEEDDFKALLVEYGNATFDCGEHAGSLEEYRAVREKADGAKLACIKWVETHMPNAEGESRAASARTLHPLVRQSDSGGEA